MGGCNQPPRPACGERIEVRGPSSAFSESVLAARVTFREPRSHVCEKRQPTLSALSGGISGIEILRDTNFAVRIRLAATYSISILRRQSWQSNGGGHNYQLRRIRDRTRSNALADHGVTVLRFWNHQVRYELDSVLKAIWFALEERPLSQPSPQSSPLPRERRALTNGTRI